MSQRVVTVVYILCVWFVISFVTNIIGPLMPVIIHDFRLSLTLAGVLPFSFFLAYGLVSIPAGVVVETRGPAFAILAAFGINLVGALGFALHPTYLAAIAALFVIGIGMAMLQVVINPLMRNAGGEAHFAFFSVLGQLVFGLASYVSPMAFSAIMAGHLAVPAMMIGRGPAWIALYWLFAAVFAAALVVTLVLNIKSFALKDDEKSGPVAVYLDLLKDKQVRWYFLGIAAYVGTEQSLADWMSPFLQAYHHIDPATAGAQAVGNFWGLMSVGCLLGLGLLKLFDSRHVLCAAVIAAAACLTGALFGPAAVSLLAFPLCGFCLSVMFSVVFALALNSVPKHHGAFSGILCSGILGGAVAPLIVGAIGEQTGLRLSLLLVFGLLAFLFSIGVRARPLIANATLFSKSA